MPLLVYITSGNVLETNDYTVSVAEGSEAYRRCGVSFNPSQDQRVEKIKALAAGLMQVIDDEMLALGPADGDGKRAMATAKTHLESAQMFAVKGCFVGRK